MKVFRKDISEMKEFTKYGDTFKQIRHNPETGWWLYDRGNSYEVVKGKKYKNPDGNYVYVYPCDEDWGTYGYTVYKGWPGELMVDFLMSAKCRTPQEIYDFKKELLNGHSY